MDVVIITPEPGKHKEIGRKLLALADSPYDVQWVTWPQTGYSIPLELFRKFDTDEPEAAKEEESPPRRRGRPRKDSTDNTATSPEEE